MSRLSSLCRATVLRLGSDGPGVQAMQRDLNAVLRGEVRLTADGQFGPKTGQALGLYQMQKHLVVDELAGPCTRTALHLREAYAPIFHDLPSAEQAPAAIAAIGQVLALPAATVNARAQILTTQADGFPDPDSAAQCEAFASAFGLQFQPFAKWDLLRLRDLIRRGPLLLRAAPLDGDPYATVLAGMRGDSDRTGRGTTLYAHHAGEAGQAVNAGRWLATLCPRRTVLFSRR